MKIVVLAAGKGSRFNSKKIIHKSFIKVKNKTLIEHILSGFSFYEKIIVLGYNNFKIKNKLKNYKNTKFLVNKKFETTEMLYSLVLALKKIKNEDVLITYSDIFYNYKLILSLLNKQKKISIPILNNWKKIWSKRLKNYQEDLETLKINDKDNLIEIGEKVKNLNDVMGQYMGLLYIPKKEINTFLKYYNHNYWKKKQITKYLNYLVNKKITIETVGYNNYWYEFDTLNELKNFKNLKFKKLNN